MRYPKELTNRPWMLYGEPALEVNLPDTDRIPSRCAFERLRRIAEYRRKLLKVREVQVRTYQQDAKYYRDKFFEELS